MKQQLPALGVWFGRAQSWLLCVIVLGTLVAPALIHVSGKASDPTPLDNRPRAQFPELPTSISSVEKFRDGVAKFIDVNFGLRVELVKLNFFIHSWIGESSVPALIKGNNGWFFLKSDNGILDQFRGVNRFSDAALDDWIDTMELYQEWLALKGIAFMILIAPNQQTIYPDQMPAYANRAWPETRLDQVARRLRERQSRLIFVDPRGDLWAGRTKAMLYRKYENHWNALGAFVAYSAMMRPIEKLFPAVEALKLSDLALDVVRLGWTIPPLSDNEPTLRFKGESKVTKKEVISTDVQPVIKVSSILDNAPAVLVYGDSFSEHWLLALMNETFRWTAYANSNHLAFPTKIIDQHRPNLVVFELVERYLARSLGDTQALRGDLLKATAPPLRDLLSKNRGNGGHVDGVLFENDAIRLPGWAIDKDANAPAREIYAYEGEQLIGAAKPAVARPDVTAGMSENTAGFNLQITPAARGGAANEKIRIFSRNPGDRVYEINITAELLQKIDTLRR